MASEGKHSMKWVMGVSVRRRIWAVVAAAACATATLGTVVAAAPASADTGTPPTQQATWGGPLHAEMYPSGLETTSDGGVVIADTGNNQVAKYNAAGTQLWRVGQWGAGTNQFDNPRDVAVDAANNVYVVDTRNSRLVKLSPTGAWLSTYGGPTGDLINFPMGATITANKLYLADTGRKKVRVIDVTSGWNEVRNVVADPTGGLYPDSGCRSLKGIRDADADAAGNVYVTGYLTNDIAKFDAAGKCIDWGVTGTGPGQFRTPYGVRTTVDPVLGQEVLLVADGLNSRVQEFSLTGTYITELGVSGTPTTPGTVTTMRRVAVAKNGSGNVWIADLWGNRIERYTRDASGYHYAQTIGAVMPPDDDTHVFQEPRQVAVGSDGIANVIDTVHHRFVRMNASGHIVGICGERASDGAELGKYNWPRGIAIDNATSQIWVADTKQNRIQIVKPDCTGLEYLGDFYSGTAANQFYWPYGVAIRQSDRIAFVADTENHRIKAYNVATRAGLGIYGSKGSGFAQFKRPTGIAVSPVDGHIFVAEMDNNRVKEMSSTDGVNFTTVRNITGLAGPEGVAIDPQGRIYIADSGNDRIVILDANATQIATITGLAHPATVGLGPDGKIYVSDTYNDVVKVYKWQATVPDTTAPDATITAPANNANVPNGPITFSGTATDNVGVARVEMMIKDRTTNKYWNGTAWVTGFSWITPGATLASPGATSTSWSFTWTPPVTGPYAVSVRAVDAAGNIDATRPFNNFTVVAAGDTVEPDAKLTAPANNTTVPSGVVTAAGTATDNVGVTAVEVMVQDRATKKYWNGSAWVTAFTWISPGASLGSPGATSTTWSYSQNLPAGIYAISVRAKDAAGNTDSTRPWVNFTAS